MAAKVCRACGAVTLTVDKNEMSNLQKKTKGTKLFMFFFVIIMSTLFAYMEYHVNFLEKELVNQHDQLEKKNVEIKKLTKNLEALNQAKPWLIKKQRSNTGVEATGNKLGGFSEVGCPCASHISLSSQIENDK